MSSSVTASRSASLPLIAGILLLLAALPLSAQELPRRIGLLLPDATHQEEVAMARELLREANARQPAGAPAFELVVRTVDGPWGMGSTRAVSLIYEDSVLLLLGALDGQNAHLAEQVAAKAHVVYIEARASEPTLSQAYVPWFLRTLPNDVQQARILLDRMDLQAGEKVLILSRDDPDTHAACRSMVKLLARETGSMPSVFRKGRTPENDPDLFAEIRRQGVQHLVYTYWSEELGALAKKIGRESPGISQYGNLRFASGFREEQNSEDMPESMVLVSPFGYSDFLADALLLSVEAICRFGPQREVLKDKIPGMEFEQGLTGRIRFDEMGNRVIR